MNMSDCKTDASCDAQKGSCDSGQKPAGNECNIAQDLLCLAKQAKHELLQEKMKKVFEAKMGKKLDSIADVAVDAMIACMEHKMAEKAACSNYQEKLFAAFKG